MRISDLWSRYALSIIMDISLNMPKAETCPKKEKGYVLVVVIFILLLLTVTVVALNRRAGLQAKIAANQVRTVQTRFGQLAAIENAAWQLLRDPARRTSAAGEVYRFAGIDYNRKILNSALTCPPNVIVVSITAPGASPPVTAGLRIRYVYQDTVYITDTNNNKIKVIDPDGNIDTLPTLDLDRPSGVAVDASGNIYISDRLHDRIIKVDTSGTSEILLDTGLDKPRGLFVQNGSITRLYIADTGNSRIRQVPSTGGVSTVNAGSLKRPRGGAADCPGNIYIADLNNDRIMQVDSTGEVSKFEAGPLKRPNDVAADDQGNIYVADHDNNRVIKVSPRGTVTTIAGSLDQPHGVAVGASGNVYIADTHDHCVRKVDTAGVISSFVGKCGQSGDNNSRNNSKLNSPDAVAVFSQATSTVAGIEWIAESY